MSIPKRRSHYSKGAKALAAKLRARKLSQADLSKICGVSQQAVSNWLAGYARPSPEAMAVLEQRFGIRMNAWVAAEKRTAA
jgi:transcriptional regulator with XRE-family HTH domain